MRYTVELDILCNNRRDKKEKKSLIRKEEQVAGGEWKLTAASCTDDALRDAGDSPQ
jgi:hypothetical protein